MRSGRAGLKQENRRWIFEDQAADRLSMEHLPYDANTQYGGNGNVGTAD
jgi:hypothetical protein